MSGLFRRITRSRENPAQATPQAPADGAPDAHAAWRPPDAATRADHDPPAEHTALWVPAAPEAQQQAATDRHAAEEDVRFEWPQTGAAEDPPTEVLEPMTPQPPGPEPVATPQPASEPSTPPIVFETRTLPAQPADPAPPAQDGQPADPAPPAQDAQPAEPAPPAQDAQPAEPAPTEPTEPISEPQPPQQPIQPTPATQYQPPPQHQPPPPPPPHQQPQPHRAAVARQQRRAVPIPADVEPTDILPDRPTTQRRGRLRRRLRYLRRLREVLMRDLGGLVFDVYRFSQEDDARQREAHGRIVAAKLGRLAAVDAEIRELERRLDDRRPIALLREPGIGGVCPNCGELHSSQANFCSNCGTTLDQEAQVTTAASITTGGHEPAQQLGHGGHQGSVPSPQAPQDPYLPPDRPR